VNRSADFESTRILELLRRLDDTVAGFTAEESAIESDMRRRGRAIVRTEQEGIESTDAQQTGRIESLDSILEEEKERVSALHAARRRTIENSRQDALWNLPRRARAERERWLGDLQMRRFQAERKQTADREAAGTIFNEYATRLNNSRKELARLERKVREAFAGYWSFLRLLKRTPDAGRREREDEALMKGLESSLADTAGRLSEFRHYMLPRVFGILALPVLVVVLALGAWLYARSAPQAAAAIWVGGGFLIAGFTALHQLGKRQACPAAGRVAAALVEARHFFEACRRAAEGKLSRDYQRIDAEFERTSNAIAVQWERAGEVESGFEQTMRRKIETQAPRAFARNDALLRARLERIERRHGEAIAVANARAEVRVRELANARQSAEQELVDEEARRWAELQARWDREIVPVYEAAAARRDAAKDVFAEMTADFVRGWRPPEQFTPAAKFGGVTLDLGPRTGQRLALPGPAALSVPLSLAFPERGSLLFETEGSGEPEVIGTLNSVILRLLAQAPPGKLSFTVIDPVGLGQNFAGLMHLADYEESLITRRIWTQQEQIEERLAELNEHIEKIIQMYLRDEYATIAEYNEKAGSTAEKYHFLVIADFPANISETAARRLQSIAASGPRCGVFTLIHWDRRRRLPDGIVAEDLRKHSVCILRQEGRLVVEDARFSDAMTLALDAPPAPEVAAEMIHKAGECSVDSMRVQVPFEIIAPEPAKYWTLETTDELRIPIGRTGATKLQMLAIGKGTRQHALFAGKTGSGKSTLFHVIITNLALSCSPEQVEFYLIDFKKGVEFKCYATKRLPHARVVAIESDREFGLSVLQRVDAELKRRGDLFRQLGVQDVPGYKRAGGREPMPRSLLMIDEFQEFFVEDDAVAQAASVLFDRIVRQGRAFGIHVLLGSQTLGGAYSLARATLGQMVIRVALQCNEADAYLIMDDNNPAPRLLSRPGEGIYNDAAGAVEGNSPFQVVWLPDDERDEWLDKVRDLAAAHPEMDGRPVVFEGNAPADVRENALLQRALAGEALASGGMPPRVWLGEPNSIKGPTEAVFQRHSGNHLLIIGQQDETALSLLGVSLLALAGQFPVGGVKFVLFHGAAPDSSEGRLIREVLRAVPHEVTEAGNHDLGLVLGGLAEELRSRMDGGVPVAEQVPVFLLVHGLQRFKKLRNEDSFDFSMGDSEAAASPAAQFGELITDGSSYGMHILASIDTFNNINRFMSRKALSEFEMRVVFQMSANDSASLVDSPKAGALGLHRALFYNELEGSLETFRPYGTPDSEWIAEAGRRVEPVG